MRVFKWLKEIFRPTWKKILIAFCLVITKYLLDYFILNSGSPILTFIYLQTIWNPIFEISNFFSSLILSLAGNNIIDGTLEAKVLDLYTQVIVPFLSWYTVICFFMFLVTKLKKQNRRKINQGEF